MRRILSLSCTIIAVLGTTACSKDSGPDGAEPTASAASAPASASALAASTAKGGSAAAAATKQIQCTDYALLYLGRKPARPILTTVKRARVPAGGVPGMKKAALFSISYLSSEQVKAACTVRKQLEQDKWTIHSMTGAGTSASPVRIEAQKAADKIQVMVGPGDQAKLGDRAKMMTVVFVIPK